MKRVLFLLLFLFFIVGNTNSEIDSLKAIRHSFNLSASLSGDYYFIGVYRPSYRLYFKRNVFYMGPNFINSYLSLTDWDISGFQLSGFSLGYRYRLGKNIRRINCFYSVDGIYNYLNGKIIARNGSVYEVYFGLEMVANVSEKIYFNAACCAGFSYRKDRFDFQITDQNLKSDNFGCAGLLEIGAGYIF